jgi:transposase
MVEINTSSAGIDTGKDSLDVALHPGGQRQRVANSTRGHGELVKWLCRHGVRRVGIEASGGYERAVVEALRAAGLEVAVLQPRQVRAYATYRLRRAKNDRIDAQLIAQCTAALERVRAAPDTRLAAFSEHLRLIEQLEQDTARAKTRREAYRDARLRRLLQREVDRLERRCRAEIALLLKEIRQHADLAHRLALIQSVDGIGERTALTLLVLMPELGQLSREQAAALAGLAPWDDDSGHHSGIRHIAGGRARVRRALYAAALPASFRWNDALVAVYRRLAAAGKPHKKIMVACARKLLHFANAVLARGTPWTTATV